MSYSFGKSIVKDGLVFYVDAANSKSYAGSGTTWSDLIGNANGTLTNGPVFSSDNGGYINLDATDDSVAFGSTASTQFNSDDPFSVEYWVNLSWTDTVAFPIIAGNKDSTSPFDGWEIYGTANERRRMIFSIWTAYSGQRIDVKMANPCPTNTWAHICATYDGSTNASGVKWYVDGSSVTTSTVYDSITTITACDYSNAQMNIGARGTLTGGFLRTSSIATLSVYNRAITAAEVAQNYNALKNRFI